MAELDIVAKNHHPFQAGPRRQAVGGLALNHVAAELKHAVLAVIMIVAQGLNQTQASHVIHKPVRLETVIV